MTIRTVGILAGAAALTALVSAVPANALTVRECSAKYRAAQSAGTLGGKTWSEFRKAECGPGASAAVSTTTGAAPTTTGTRAGAVFPAAVSPKYASQSAGRARMHTCLDQYNANKATGGNSGLKWIQKGGGYYSECNKRLSSR